MAVDEIGRPSVALRYNDNSATKTFSQMPLVAPVMGERLDIRQPALSKQWWKGPQPQARPAVMTEGNGVTARVPAQS